MADRWSKADCLRDVFELLAREIPLIDRPSKPPVRLSEKTVDAVRMHLPQVSALVVHRHVLRMIEEMISESFPRSTSGEQYCPPPPSRPPSVAGMLAPSLPQANTHVQGSGMNFQLPFSYQQPFDYNSSGADTQNLDIDGLLSYPGVFDFDNWM